MRQKVRGAIASVNSAIQVVVDSFNRSDGPVGNGWTDWSFLESFNPLGILNKHVGQADQELPFAHIALTREVPFEGNYEVVVECNVPDDSDMTHQVAPLVLANPNASNPELLGIRGSYDVSIARFPYMIFNEFNTIGAEDHGDIFDHTQYHEYDTQWPIDFPLLDQSAAAPLNMFYKGVVDFDNQLVAYFQSRDCINWEKVAGPITPPLELLSHTHAGVSMIYAPYPLPTDGSFSNPYHPFKRIVIRPFTGSLSLPEPPAEPVFGTVVESEGAVASIDIPYPDGLQAGDMLFAVVHTPNNGSPGIGPTGWTRDSVGLVAGVVRGAFYVMDSPATGNETGTVNFAKATGTGTMLGAMFYIRGANYKAPQQSAASQNTSASTTLRAPSVIVQGPSRRVLWFGFTGANETFTPPSGFDLHTTLGAGGTAGSIGVASRVYSVMSGDDEDFSIGPFDGSITGSAATVGISAVVHPDPR